MKMQFSGHESFICKHFWLKKGFDFIQNGGSFSDEESAVIDLGVGRNMVLAIQYWLKSFGIIDQENKPSEIGNFLFSNNGVDPYLEDLGSLWLLHYYIIKTEKASIYSLFFNDFRKFKIEFTKPQLLSFLSKRVELNEKSKLSEKTLVSDINVFVRTYLKPTYNSKKIDVEDDFTNLMVELELMTSSPSENVQGGRVDWYKVEAGNREGLPWQLVLFVILDNSKYRNSVSFRELLAGSNSPGKIFALNEEGLFNKIEEMTKATSDVVYTEVAGVRELQLKGNLNKWELLNEYYQN